MTTITRAGPTASDTEGETVPPYDGRRTKCRRGRQEESTKDGAKRRRDRPRRGRRDEGT